MITYQVEKYSLVIEEMKELYEYHWEEIAGDKDIIKLKPNYKAYLNMDSLGILNLVTVRDGDKLVGYHLSMVYPHLHYTDSLTAFTDIFFLKKEYRKGRVGITLFKFMEKTLQERGVQKIYMGTKLSLDIGKLLERLGYTPIERLYTKILKE